MNICCMPMLYTGFHGSSQCARTTCASLHSQVDFLGESTTGNLHLVGREQDHSIGNVLGLASVEDIVDMPVSELRQATKVVSASHLCTYTLKHAQVELWSMRAVTTKDMTTKDMSSCLAVQAMLDEIGIASSQYPEGHPERAIFCSRTLNLRAIQAIGAAALPVRTQKHRDCRLAAA
jgi:hypothetical protein